MSHALKIVKLKKKSQLITLLIYLSIYFYSMRKLSRQNPVQREGQNKSIGLIIWSPSWVE